MGTESTSLLAFISLIAAHSFFFPPLHIQGKKSKEQMKVKDLMMQKKKKNGYNFIYLHIQLQK